MFDSDLNTEPVESEAVAFSRHLAGIPGVSVCLDRYRRTFVPLIGLARTVPGGAGRFPKEYE